MQLMDVGLPFGGTGAAPSRGSGSGPPRETLPCKTVSRAKCVRRASEASGCGRLCHIPALLISFPPKVRSIRSGPSAAASTQLSCSTGIDLFGAGKATSRAFPIAEVHFPGFSKGFTPYPARSPPAVSLCELMPGLCFGRCMTWWGRGRVLFPTGSQASSPLLPSGMNSPGCDRS